MPSAHPEWNDEEHPQPATQQPRPPLQPLPPNQPREALPPNQQQHPPPPRRPMFQSSLSSSSLVYPSDEETNPEDSNHSSTSGGPFGVVRRFPCSPIRTTEDIIHSISPAEVSDNDDEDSGSCSSQANTNHTAIISTFAPRPPLPPHETNHYPPERFSLPVVRSRWFPSIRVDRTSRENRPPPSTSGNHQTTTNNNDSNNHYNTDPSGDSIQAQCGTEKDAAPTGQPPREKDETTTKSTKKKKKTRFSGRLIPHADPPEEDSHRPRHANQGRQRRRPLVRRLTRYSLRQTRKQQQQQNATKKDHSHLDHSGHHRIEEEEDEEENHSRNSTCDSAVFRSEVGAFRVAGPDAPSLASGEHFDDDDDDDDETSSASSSSAAPRIDHATLAVGPSLLLASVASVTPRSLIPSLGPLPSGAAFCVAPRSPSESPPRRRLPRARVVKVVEESILSAANRTVLAVLAAAVVLVLVSVVVLRGREDAGGDSFLAGRDPSQDPYQILAPLVGGEALLRPDPGGDPDLQNNSEAEAFVWLTLRDDSGLAKDPSTPAWRIVQRFVAAHLYFATGGPDHWEAGLGFLSSSHECDWHELRRRTGSQGLLSGIQCDSDNRIHRLRIAENHLRHHIPTTLGLLSSLETLDLPNNELTGTIPEELSDLTALREFVLTKNPLSGSIPDRLVDRWEAVRIIGLTDTRLTGTLPTGLGNLTLLQRLFLHLNGFSGSLPPELGGATSLETLFLASNAFTGTLPQEYGSLTKLRVLDVSDNQLSGTIPSVYETNWRDFDEDWFLYAMATPAPSHQPSTTPPTLRPSVSPAPTATAAPTSVCGLEVGVEMVCPRLPCEQDRTCRKQPYKMEYRLGARRCEESILRTCPTVDKDSCTCTRNDELSPEDLAALEFDCQDFDGGPTNADASYYVVASSDWEGRYVYAEGKVDSGGRIDVLDPASIQIDTKLYLALYEYNGEYDDLVLGRGDEPNNGRAGDDPTNNNASRGRLLQRVSFLTSCDPSAKLNLLNIFGSFQLVGLESNIQQIGFANPQTVDFELKVSVQSHDTEERWLELDTLNLVVFPETSGIIPPQVLEYNVLGRRTPYEAPPRNILFVSEQEFEVIATVQGKLQQRNNPRRLRKGSDDEPAQVSENKENMYALNPGYSSNADTDPSLKKEATDLGSMPSEEIEDYRNVENECTILSVSKISCPIAFV